MRTLTTPVRPHENVAHIHALQGGDLRKPPSNRRRIKIQKGPAPTLLPPVSSHDSLSPCRSAAIDSLSCGDTVRFSAVERS
jgi:hypothetical protein